MYVANGDRNLFDYWHEFIGLDDVNSGLDIIQYMDWFKKFDTQELKYMAYIICHFFAMYKVQTSESVGWVAMKGCLPIVEWKIKPRRVKN